MDSLMWKLNSHKYLTPKSGWAQAKHEGEGGGGVGLQVDKGILIPNPTH